MRNRSIWIGAVLAACIAPPARADVYTEFTGTRSLAMGGAHRALGSNNETIVLNPAGMAASKRYHIDVQYGYGTGDRLHNINGSVVDSKSGPVAGGMALTRSWGNESGANPGLMRYYGAVAYDIGSTFAIGLSTSYIRGDFRDAGVKQDVNSVNGTVGALLNLGDVLGAGVSFQNVLPGKDMESNLFRPQLGFALAVHTSILAITGDMVLDMRSDVKNRIDWHGGAEYFFYETVAVRAGYHHSAPETLVNQDKQHFVSGGVGILSNSGAFNGSLERAVSGNTAHWRFLASLQFFM